MSKIIKTRLKVLSCAEEVSWLDWEEIATFTDLYLHFVKFKYITRGSHNQPLPKIHVEVSVFQYDKQAAEPNSNFLLLLIFFKWI